MPPVKKNKPLPEPIHVTNPVTGLLMLVGSRAHQRLVQAGVINTPLPPEPEPEPEPEQNTKKLKKHTKSELIKLAKQNETKLQNKSKKETNDILRKLLILKLAPKKEKSKKKKKKIVVSSDESSSDSSSNDSESE
jgi:hypothetical protein